MRSPKLERVWRLALSALCLLLTAAAHAQAIKILVQESPLAGFQFHAGADVWPQLEVGDSLTLAREPDNRHDVNAVRVEWRGRMLGYLPRAENRTVAAEMDRGMAVSARIVRLQESRNPWLRVRIAVFVVL